MSRPCVSTLRSHVVLAVAALLAVGVARAQVPGPNVNMVSGTGWPGGDPFLQRQNEPSVAVSTRNPMHLLAGANDYRTVDLPGLPDDKMTGDAWLGVFTSSDGGATWRSTLIPGYPQEQSSTSPLHGYRRGGRPRRARGAARPLLLLRHRVRPDEPGARGAPAAGGRRRHGRCRHRHERGVRRALHRQQRQGERRADRPPRDHRGGQQHRPECLSRQAVALRRHAAAGRWHLQDHADARRKDGHPVHRRRQRLSRLQPVHGIGVAGDGPGNAHVQPVDQLRRHVEHAGGDQRHPPHQPGRHDRD